MNYDMYLRDRTPKTRKKVFFIRSIVMKICTHVKPKINWGNCPEIFSIFFIENELFTENLKEGVHGNEPNG